MPGATNYGREDSPWGIITCKSSLAHARSIVNNKSSNILVAHFVRIAKSGLFLSELGGLIDSTFIASVPYILHWIINMLFISIC